MKKREMEPIDLRSDTVTRPTEAMRRAMAEAPVNVKPLPTARAHATPLEGMSMKERYTLHGQYAALVAAHGGDVEALAAVVGTISVFLPLAGLVDIEAEKARITKERDKAAQGLEMQRKKLSNEQFTSQAPANVVEAARAREAELAAKVAQLEERLRSLGA